MFIFSRPSTIKFIFHRFGLWSVSLNRIWTVQVRLPQQDLHTIFVPNSVEKKNILGLLKIYTLSPALIQYCAVWDTTLEKIDQNLFLYWLLSGTSVGVAKPLKFWVGYLGIKSCLFGPIFILQSLLGPELQKEVTVPRKAAFKFDQRSPVVNDEDFFFWPCEFQTGCVICDLGIGPHGPTVVE